MQQATNRFAKQLLSVRDDRSSYFNAALFDEDSWDLMLLLFVAKKEQRTVDRRQIEMADIARPNTLDRWLRVLSQEGITQIDGDDGGTIALTENACGKMEALLGTVIDD
jgi:hypothetical protein